MRRTYTVISWAIAGGVVVQAAAIAFGFGGMMHHVQEGGVVDKAFVESEEAGFTGALGFVVHAIVGGMVLPLLALALLVVSFFVHVGGAKAWAGLVLGLVFLQVMAGYSIEDLPYLGLLHGANALAILVTASLAARRAQTAGSVTEHRRPTANVGA